jgi:hypothetical protein
MPTATIHVRSRLTQARVKEALLYAPESGAFTWRIRRNSHGGKVRPGAPAGQVNKYGYVVIGLDGERHFAHRIAWLYMTGEWPSIEVDHENRTPGDNRWINLRPATATQNKMNTRIRCDNRSGIKGVGFDKERRRWVARLKVNGVMLLLKRFDTIEEAAAARRAAELQHFGEFAAA